MSDYLKDIEAEINSIRSYGAESITLDNCDKEPIHFIGNIQNHGVLIVTDLDNPLTQIDFISANTNETLGIDADKLLGQPLHLLITPHSIEMMLDSLKTPSHSHQTKYDLEIYASDKRSVQASFHKHKQYLLIELQPFLTAETIRTGFGKSGKDTLAEFTSKMLRSHSFNELSKAMVSFFYETLKYDRVMFYKFDDDGHGEVVAEEKKHELDSFLGLHYPASDIPQFARYLYVQNRCRIISNILSKPVPILSNNANEDEFQLDLRFSNLRSMSPIHIEYLSNMGIQASLTMSIVKDNKLFGMLIMHNYSPIYCELATRDAIEKLSYLSSDYFSLLDKIEAATDLERSQDISSLLNMYLFDTEGNVDFAEIAKTLKRILNGDGVFVCIDGQELLSVGLNYPDNEPVISACKNAGLFDNPITFSNNLSETCPQLFELNNNISGLMLIKLPSEDLSYILVTRHEQAEFVRWAGRKEKYSEASDGRLHARRSFQEWREFTKNCSRPWTNSDTLNARNIRSVFTRYLLQLNEKRLAKLVSFDTLTDLPNRHYITNYIDTLLAQNIDIALIFIDCDRFKTINDSLGHDIGDKVLDAIGKRLKSLNSDKITAARLGGDEFTVLMQTDNIKEIETKAKELVTLFREPISFQHYNFNVPASIGIALSSKKSTRSSLMRDADMAMYHAKQKGGNAYKFVNEELMENADERLKIEQDIHQALQKKEIVNFYQPIVDSQTQQLSGYEVLCRWIKSENEIIPPDKFLGVAEETGIIIPIGLQIIDQALIDLKKILTINNELIISINFSPRQMLDQQMLRYLINQVKVHKVQASNICVELTEESYIDDEMILIKSLRLLKNNGFKIALDDFGSGYSSLKYLSSLPLNTVKFDKTLIDQVFDNKRAYALLTACKNLADVCGLDTVAEGIETETQKYLISEIGINKQQGYLWGKPRSFEETFNELKKLS